MNGIAHRPAAIRTRRARVVRRRRATALAILVALAAAALVAITTLADPGRPSEVELLVGGRVLRTLDARSASRAQARRLPATVTVSAGGVRTVRAIDRRRAATMLRHATGSAVTLPARPIAVSIAAPVVAQRLRDNCETAALQVLLATAGVRADQLALQRQLPRSGPLDPRAGSGGPVWGDPDAGYVGRADGTGSWGGFGVYPRPIVDLAARRGRRLRDLTGSPPSSLYRALLRGRAVMAWVGLDDGPYRDWVTPAGRAIRVNLNEHTVVLTGMRRDGSLQLVNVLRGTRETWSRARFEQAWGLLDRRAVVTA